MGGFGTVNLLKTAGVEVRAFIYAAAAFKQQGLGITDFRYAAAAGGKNNSV